MQRKVENVRKIKMPQEDALQFLWAVSYSDLLMVLIAFLIIFYGFASMEGESVTQRITHSLKVNLGATESQAQASGATGSADDRKTARKDSIVILPLEALSKAMSAKDVQMASDEKGIVIDLPENIYGNAKFNVDGAVAAALEKVLNVVKPFSSDVALTFVGHSDETPFMRIGHNLVNSNLILSNLRAAKAVEYAINMGFNARWVSAQGVAEYQRNTRSLSLRLIERRLQ